MDNKGRKNGQFSRQNVQKKTELGKQGLKNNIRRQKIQNEKNGQFWKKMNEKTDNLLNIEKNKKHEKTNNIPGAGYYVQATMKCHPYW